jgi:hypothetical protein
MILGAALGAAAVGITVTGAGADPAPWQRQASPSPGAWSRLDAASAAAADDVWAVGSYRETLDAAPLPLIEHYDGSSWQRVGTPDLKSGALYGVVAVAADDAWAVGGIPSGKNGNKAALILHWDGSRWRRADDMGSIAPGTILYSVSASGPGDVWAVGRYQPKGRPRGRVLRFDGSGWSVVRTDVPGGAGNWLNGIAAPVADDVVTAGSQLKHYRAGLAPVARRLAPGGDAPLTVDQGQKRGGKPCPVAPTIDLPPIARGGSGFRVNCGAFLAVAGRHEASGDVFVAVGEEWSHALAEVQHGAGAPFSDVSPHPSQPTARLEGVAACAGDGAPFVAVGEAYDATFDGQRALVDRYAGGSWTADALDPGLTPAPSDLRGVATGGVDGWAVGAVHLSGGVQQTLVVHAADACS